MTESNNRYIVFAYETFYPAGGWGDFLAYVDSIEAAKQLICTHSTGQSWSDAGASVVDWPTGQVQLSGTGMWDSNKGLKWEWKSADQSIATQSAQKSPPGGKKPLEKSPIVFSKKGRPTKWKNEAERQKDLARSAVRRERLRREREVAKIAQLEQPKALTHQPEPIQDTPEATA